MQLLSDKISLAGGSIGLGGQATMSAVLGEALVTLFNTHVHPTAQGPSGPPVPRWPPDRRCCPRASRSSSDGGP
nr:hypothetical protein GCM10020093_031290 [Planobispora longispora]